MTRRGTAILLAAVAAAALVGSPRASFAARLYGLVVGIDDYRHIPKLAGAVNDARLLREALLAAGAEVVLLLDEQASRRGVVDAWRALTAKAKAGDTLVFTYSGHGAQQPERVAGNEADGMDEVLVLRDFRTERPGNGERIMDDELHEWFAQVPHLSIILVADACHSGTMTRNVDPRVGGGRVRTIGDYGAIDAARDELPRPRPTGKVSELESPHVTFFSAGREDQKIAELSIEGRMHGALSWTVARALRGAADRDADGTVSKGELEAFVVENVRMLAEGRQEPQVLPRGHATRSLFRTAEGGPGESPPTGVSVRIDGSGPMPERLFVALRGVRRIRPGEVADVVFDLHRRQALNGLGDVIANLTSLDGLALQAIVDKLTAIKTIRALSERHSLKLRFDPGDGTHRGGAIVRFTLDAHRHPNVTLVNLAADGTVQHLYPRPRKGGGGTGDALTIPTDEPFRLPFEVAPPFGADHLVAVVSEMPLPELHRALLDLDGKRAATELAAALGRHVGAARQYQMGVLGLYTAP